MIRTRIPPAAFACVAMAAENPLDDNSFTKYFYELPFYELPCIRAYRIFSTHSFSPFWMTKMTNRFFWTFSLICCLGLAAAPPARSEQGPVPACLYNSKLYSDGAYICVQKSLMLTCSSDGTRATWKTVADKDVSERCVNPIALSVPPTALAECAPNAHGASLERPGQGRLSKCFSFNGKQYCE